MHCLKFDYRQQIKYMRHCENFCKLLLGYCNFFQFVKLTRKEFLCTKLAKGLHFTLRLSNLYYDSYLPRKRSGCFCILYQ